MADFTGGQIAECDREQSGQYMDVYLDRLYRPKTAEDDGGQVPRAIVAAKKRYKRRKTPPKDVKAELRKDEFILELIRAPYVCKFGATPPLPTGDLDSASPRPLSTAAPQQQLEPVPARKRLGPACTTCPALLVELQELRQRPDGEARERQRAEAATARAVSAEEQARHAQQRAERADGDAHSRWQERFRKQVEAKDAENKTLKATTTPT